MFDSSKIGFSDIIFALIPLLVFALGFFASLASDRFYFDDNNKTVSSFFETVSLERMYRMSESGSDFICDYELYNVSFMCKPMKVCNREGFKL